MNSLKEFEIAKHFSWIDNYLAIGDLIAGSHPKRWQFFQAILNVSEVDTGPGEGAYLWLPIKDGNVEAFSKIIDEAVSFIEENISKQRSTLVHCAAGSSRSVAVVLFFLCKKTPPNSEHDLRALFIKIKQNHPPAFPNQNFIDEIAAYYNVPPPQIGW